MKKYKIDTKQNEELLDDLFSSFELEEPSNNFTVNTMNLVMQESKEKAKIRNKKNSFRTRFYYTLASAAAIVLIFILQYSDIIHFDKSNLNTIQNVFSTISQSLTISFTKVPNLVYLIFIGGSILYLFDKLIYKLQQTN